LGPPGATLRRLESGFRRFFPVSRQDEKRPTLAFVSADVRLFVHDTAGKSLRCAYGALAMACRERDLDECLDALRFPFVHRRQIRTTSLLERLCGEGKRRSEVIPRFPSEATGMALLFAVLVDASEGWRGASGAGRAAPVLSLPKGGLPEAG